MINIYIDKNLLHKYFCPQPDNKGKCNRTWPALLISYPTKLQHWETTAVLLKITKWFHEWPGTVLLFSGYKDNISGGWWGGGGGGGEAAPRRVVYSGHIYPLIHYPACLSVSHNEHIICHRALLFCLCHHTQSLTIFPGLPRSSHLKLPRNTTKHESDITQTSIFWFHIQPHLR